MEITIEFIIVNITTIIRIIFDNKKRLLLNLF